MINASINVIDSAGYIHLSLSLIPRFKLTIIYFSD